MTTPQKIAITGIQPTGRPHIGNYFGAMKPIVDMQHQFDTYIFIADFHALTTAQDPAMLREQTCNLILDYLAIGLDPQKVTFYKQSSIPEVSELTWIFNCLMSVAWLERAHAYKDKTAKGIEASVGLFDYPILMAADILIVDAQVVPVGQDQKQHVEMAREIARKFNQTYSDTFTEPQESIVESVATVPGTDGQKMSKSYGNTIPLFATDAEIKKSIMSIVTDSYEPSDPKDPETCNVFAIHKLVTPPAPLSEIRDGYIKGGLGYGDAKTMLLENYLAFIAPMREKRAYYEHNPDVVAQIMHDGEMKMRQIVQSKMIEVRKKIGII